MDDTLKEAWVITQKERRARLVFNIERPYSPKHAEAVARETMPEGWLFGGTRTLGHGWYRAWAYLPANVTA